MKHNNNHSLYTKHAIPVKQKACYVYREKLIAEILIIHFKVLSLTKGLTSGTNLVSVENCVILNI